MSRTTYGMFHGRCVFWLYDHQQVATHPVLLWTLGDPRPPSEEKRGEMPSTLYEGSTLARAAEATTKLRAEIDQLWCDSISADDDLVSERLVAVSHAIQRVFNLLEQSPVIG